MGTKAGSAHWQRSQLRRESHAQVVPARHPRVWLSGHAPARVEAGVRSVLAVQAVTVTSARRRVTVRMAPRV